MDPRAREEGLERLVPLDAQRGAERAARSGALELEPVEPLRPRRVGELVDAALEVLRLRFVACVGLCVLLWFPLRLVQPFVAPYNWIEADGIEDFIALGLFLAVTLIGAGVQVICISLVAQIAMAALERRELSAREALRRGLRRFFAICGVGILTTLISGMGMLACFVPGILLAWKLSLAQVALVLEGVSVGSALQRSFTLTTGSFWRWVALMVVVIAIVAPFTSLPGLADDPNMRPMVLGALPLSEPVFDAVWVVVSSLFMGLGTALGAVATTVYYVDCRVRREGRDLDLWLERIAGSAATGAGAGAAP